MSDPALTTRQCADWLGLSVSYVLGEVKDGHLLADNVGRGAKKARYRIRYSDFLTYLKARRYRHLPTPEVFSKPQESQKRDR